MIKKVLFFVIVSSGFFYGNSMAESPSQVGGFKLGMYISAYKDIVDMNTSLPIRYAESISEVEIKPTDQLSSGLIAYGTCADPGKVVRIKLKYADSSRDFYDKLLSRFEKKFGKPTEWRGDPFHIVIAWKWSFTDKSNNRISLILQHNKLDTDEKIGNSIKLTMTNAIDKERQCFDKAHPGNNGPPSSGSPPAQFDWDMLVPR